MKAGDLRPISHGRPSSEERPFPRSLATLAGYDLTCNKIHAVLPKIITVAAPGVFKDSNRFKHIVKNNHYLRVVSEGGYKDIITTAAGALAFNQSDRSPEAVEWRQSSAVKLAWATLNWAQRGATTFWKHPTRRIMPMPGCRSR